MSSRSFVISCAIIAIGGATLRSSVIALDELPPFCDDSTGRRARIEYGAGAGWDFVGTYDCLTLTNGDGIVIYRHIPSLRHLFKVQLLQSAGGKVPEGGRWYKDSRHVDPLPRPIVSAGIGVGDDGRTVYVTAAVSTELVVFDRDPETGLLSFHNVRSFSTESARSEFLVQLSKAWQESRPIGTKFWERTYSPTVSAPAR
jgi:hypothetical protein